MRTHGYRTMITEYKYIYIYTHIHMQIHILACRAKRLNTASGTTDPLA
jgi:hypothetical protein